MSLPDLVIKNAEVLDGSGGRAFRADVTVRDGRIESVGTTLSGGRREIDADGAVLAPGFVDAHAHDDAALLAHPHMEWKLAQGITTVVIGNCGFSVAPYLPGRPTPPGVSSLFPDLDFARQGPSLESLATFRAATETSPPAINALSLIGHNTVRALVMGDSERAPTEAELVEMRDHIERALDDGAAGLSSGLIYRPGKSAKTDELVRLCEPLRARGGLYTTHLRDEADGLLDAMNEALSIGREAQVDVHISHHKFVGQRNWGRIGESLALIDGENARGGNVTFDVYPYTMGSGPMIEYFDLDAIDVELARVMRLATCPAFPAWEGRSLASLAESEKIDLATLVHKILTAPRGHETVSIQLIVDERDIEENLRHARCLIGSDGIANLSGKPHPRLFGTMPRILAEYSRQRGVLSLEAAVAKMTSQACRRFGIGERGFVQEGYVADLVLFDRMRVQDTATYDDPKRTPTGIATVIVNGAIAWEGGCATGSGAGRVLRYARDVAA